MRKIRFCLIALILCESLILLFFQLNITDKLTDMFNPNKELGVRYTTPLRRALPTASYRIDDYVSARGIWSVISTPWQ